MSTRTRWKWFVASVIGAALAGCGGGNSDAPDASVADAFVRLDAASDGAVDGMTGPPPVTRVGVTVLSESGSGLPDTTATVIFAGPGNELVKQGLVDAKGQEAADLPAGGTVSVLRVTDGTPPRERLVSLISIRNVKPGDALVFGRAAGSRSGTEEAFVSYRPVAGATIHRFFSPCGQSFTSNSQSFTMEWSPVCVRPAELAVLATASSDDRAFVPQYQWKVGAVGADLDGTWSEMPIFTVNLKNAPVAGFQRVDRSVLLPPTYGLELAPSRSTGLIPPGSSAIELRYPPAEAGQPVEGIGLVTARFGSDARSPSQALYVRVSGTAASADVDWNMLPLPVIETSATLSGKVVSWTQSGTGKPDVRQIDTRSTHTAGDHDYTVEWTVIDGSSDSAAELPGLPTMFAEVDPTQQLTSHPLRADVRYVDYSNVDGYDQARQLPIGSLTQQEGGFCTGCGVFGDKLYNKRLSAKSIQL